MKTQIITLPKISEKDFDKVLSMLDLLEINHEVDTDEDYAEAVHEHYHAHTLHVWEERGEVRLHVENYDSKTVFEATNEVEGFVVSFRGEDRFVEKSGLSETDTELDVIRLAFPDITREQIDDEDDDVQGPEVEKGVGQGGFWLTDDGFMKNLSDTNGLTKYLRGAGVFTDDDYITTAIN